MTLKILRHRNKSLSARNGLVLLLYRELHIIGHHKNAKMHFENARV